MPRPIMSKSASDAVRLLAMEAAASNAMATVVAPFAPSAAANWIDRAVHYAENAGMLAAPGARVPALLLITAQMAEAFARGQSLRAYDDSMRERWRHAGVIVWSSHWTVSLEGECETRAAVHRYRDDFRAVLETRTGSTGSTPCYGPPKTTLDEARHLAGLIERAYHRLLPVMQVIPSPGIKPNNG